VLIEHGPIQEVFKPDSQSVNKASDFCFPLLSLFFFLSFFLTPFPSHLGRGIYDIVVLGACVGQYNNKGSFGELALMYNTPRAATIVATQEGSLWGLVRTHKSAETNKQPNQHFYELLWGLSKLHT